MKYIKVNNLEKYFFTIQKIDASIILLFILTTFSYPFNSNYIIPLFILVYGLQFYKLLSRKIDIKELLNYNFLLLIYSAVFFRSTHTLILAFNLVFLIAYTFKHTPKNLKIKCKLEVYTLFFFVLIAINLMIFKPVFKGIDTYLYILFYPILFLLIKLNKLRFSITSALKIYISSIIIVSLQLLILNLIENKLHLKIGTFFAEKLGLTHVYFGLCISVACSFILILFSKGKNYFNKKISVFVLLFFIVLLASISARAALFGVLIIVLYYIFNRINIHWVKKCLLLTTMFFISIALSYKFVTRVKNDIEYAKKLYYSVKNDNKEDIIMNSWRNIYMRYLVTKYTLDQIKENLVLGVGMQNIKEKLGKKIHKDGYKYFNFINPHNQYLHIFLGMGVFAFIYFLMMLLEIYKEQSKFPFFFILILILMLTESILDRAKGISLFFLFSLILYMNNNSKLLKTTDDENSSYC